MRIDLAALSRSLREEPRLSPPPRRRRTGRRVPAEDPHDDDPRREHRRRRHLGLRPRPADAWRRGRARPRRAGGLQPVGRERQPAEHHRAARRRHANPPHHRLHLQQGLLGGDADHRPGGREDHIHLRRSRQPAANRPRPGAGQRPAHARAAGRPSAVQGPVAPVPAFAPPSPSLPAHPARIDSPALPGDGGLPPVPVAWTGGSGLGAGSPADTARAAMAAPSGDPGLAGNVPTASGGSLGAAGNPSPGPGVAPQRADAAPADAPATDTRTDTATRTATDTRTITPTRTPTDTRTSTPAWTPTVTTRFSYDPANAGDPTARQDPNGSATGYAYDSATGDLLSATDGCGNKTTFLHDRVGRVSAATRPSGAHALDQIELAIHAPVQVVQGELSQAAGSALDGQRHAPQLPADAGDDPRSRPCGRGDPGGPRPLQEQAIRRILRVRSPGRHLGRALEAAQLDQVLARHARAMPAGGQDPQPRAGGEEPPRQAGACGEQPRAHATQPHRESASLGAHGVPRSAGRVAPTIPGRARGSTQRARPGAQCDGALVNPIHRGGAHGDQTGRHRGARCGCGAAVTSGLRAHQRAGALPVPGSGFHPARGIAATSHSGRS